MSQYGIFYDKLIKTANIKPGDKIKIKQTSDNGRFVGNICATVLKVYRHHVLLDFGVYKECRRIADIKLNLVTY